MRHLRIFLEWNLRLKSVDKSRSKRRRSSQRNRTAEGAWNIIQLWYRRWIWKLSGERIWLHRAWSRRV